MWKIIILFFIMIFHQLQSQKINSLNDDEKLKDSLALLIKTTKNDSLKCFYSYRLASIFIKDSQIHKYNEYLKIGNTFSSKYPYLKACSGYYNALRNLNQDSIDIFFKEIYATKNALRKYRFKASYEIQSIILQNIAMYYGNKGESEKAIKVLIEEAIPMAKKAGSSVMLGSLYKTIGIKMTLDNEDARANYYFNKALEQFEFNNDNSLVYKEEKLATEIYAAENLIELYKFKEAKRLLDKVYTQLKTNKKSNINEQYYYSIGYYYYKTKDYNKSIKNYDKGISLALLSNSTSVIRLGFGKFDALFANNEYQKAYELINYISKLDYLSINEKIVCYLELSKTLEKLGRHKEAYYFAESYIRVNDSLVKQNSKNEIYRLEAKFNKAENESKIKQLESQKQKALLIAHNNKLYYVLFGLLSFILFAIILFLRKNSKTQRLLTVEKEKNYKQNISTLKTQKEIEVMQAMIDGEEIERKRIARELHDGIGSKLSALKILMSRIDNQQISNENLMHFDELLSTSITELRQVSYNLVPESLLKLGLENALGDLCHLLHSEKVKIEFQAYDITNTIPVSSQINIYRIVQELLNNALKHSECSEILVSCSQNGKTFFISVEDNGKGFDISNSDDKTGLGIKNLKSRVELLNGTYNVKSNKSGTYYNIELKI